MTTSEPTVDLPDVTISPDAETSSQSSGATMNWIKRFGKSAGKKFWTMVEAQEKAYRTSYNGLL
jgi:hypothetical protein